MDHLGTEPVDMAIGLGPRSSSKFGNLRSLPGMQDAFVGDFGLFQYDLTLQGCHWSGKSQGNSRSGKSQGIL